MDELVSQFDNIFEIMNNKMKQKAENLVLPEIQAFCNKYNCSFDKIWTDDYSFIFDGEIISDYDIFDKFHDNKNYIDDLRKLCKLLNYEIFHNRHIVSFLKNVIVEPKK